MARTITPREIGIAVGAFVVLLVVGTIGYSLLLDENLFEALFRTVNTIYTAGLVDAPDDTTIEYVPPGLTLRGTSDRTVSSQSTAWKPSRRGHGSSRRKEGAGL